MNNLVKGSDTETVASYVIDIRSSQREIVRTDVKRKSANRWSGFVATAGLIACSMGQFPNSTLVQMNPNVSSHNKAYDVSVLKGPSQRYTVIDVNNIEAKKPSKEMDLMVEKRKSPEIVAKSRANFRYMGYKSKRAVVDELGEETNIRDLEHPKKEIYKSRAANFNYLGKRPKRTIG